MSPDEAQEIAKAVVALQNQLRPVTQKGVDDWINAEKSESAKFRRGSVVEGWAKANRKATPLEALESIRTHATDIYESVKTYLASLPKTLAISTKYLYRSIFPSFFENMFGTKNFDRVEYDSKVTIEGDNYTATTKGSPKLLDLQNMLRAADLRDRAFGFHVPKFWGPYLAFFSTLKGEPTSRVVDVT
jgi:hypothetical protein